MNVKEFNRLGAVVLFAALLCMSLPVYGLETSSLGKKTIPIDCSDYSNAQTCEVLSQRTLQHELPTIVRTVRVITKHDLNFQYVEVFQNGELVFSERGEHWQVADEIAPYLDASIDLSGDGTPHLIMINYQSGSGGYLSCRILRLGDVSRVVAHFEATGQVKFQPNQLGAGWTISIQDDHWRFALAQYSTRYGWPALTYHFEHGEFVLSKSHLAELDPLYDNTFSQLGDVLARITSQERWDDFLIRLMMSGRIHYAQLLHQWLAYERHLMFSYADVTKSWKRIYTAFLSHPDVSTFVSMSDTFERAQDHLLLKDWCPTGPALQEALTKDRLHSWSDALEQYKSIEEMMLRGEGCRRPFSMYSDVLDRPSTLLFSFVRLRIVLLQLRLGKLQSKELQPMIFDVNHPHFVPVGFADREILDSFRQARRKDYHKVCSSVLENKEQWLKDDMMLPHHVPGTDLDKQPTAEDLCYPVRW